MKFYNTDLHFNNLHIKHDYTTGLIAIIAIHNLNNGPALGGCRFVNYSSVDDAIKDAMSLAKAMTYKSAMANLPLGGGKSVIVSHPGIQDRGRVLEQFGQFVNELNGTYITASDSGTNENDMKIVARATKHVTSISSSNAEIDNTAFMTASGVVRAIQAAVMVKQGKSSLDGVHVAIQGAGSVGTILTKILLSHGAQISICDINRELLEERMYSLSVNKVDTSELMGLKCDVIAPCALGGALSECTISDIKASIVCGAANNQLHSPSIGEELHKRDILFVPDYVANAGGVICAAAQAGVITKNQAQYKVDAIYDTIIDILERSKDQDLPSNVIANLMAEERF